MVQNRITWFKTAQDRIFRPCLANPITGTTWPPSQEVTCITVPGAKGTSVVQSEPAAPAS